MARALALTAGALAAAIGGCNPFGGGGAFTCDTNEQCDNGPGGRCESTGYCSYLDPDCLPSGQRYGDNAGNNSHVCVDQVQTDGGVDGMGQSVCYGSTGGLAKPCFPAALTGSLTLTNPINTTSDPMCATNVTGAPGLCVIGSGSITVSGNIAVTGNRPLVLVASGTIDITGAGMLDAASHRSMTAPYDNIQLGANADPSGQCNSPGIPGASAGGAGGTFGVRGGDGGDGANGSNGVTSAPVQQNITLRGGCSGQTALGTGGGRGGHGGGVLYFIANTITVAGTINASGEGGGRGVSGNNAGGGGGGAGGLIGFDASTINNTGVVFANGGGGGEGSGAGNSGNPGFDPTGVAAANGGGGASTGGNGGTGGAGGSVGGSPMGGNGGDVSNDGGGGGGGGTGVIKVFGGGTLGGDHSPTPS